MVSAGSSRASSAGSPTCWICLGEGELDATQSGKLVSACACPGRYVHPACLARWQLHQAGRR